MGNHEAAGVLVVLVITMIITFFLVGQHKKGILSFCNALAVCNGNSIPILLGCFGMLAAQGIAIWMIFQFDALQNLTIVQGIWGGISKTRTNS